MHASSRAWRNYVEETDHDGIDHLHAFAAKEIDAEDVMRGLGIKCYSHLIAVLFGHNMIRPPGRPKERPEIDERR